MATNGLALDRGVLAPEHGVLAPEHGVLAPEHGVLALEHGVLAPEHGVLACCIQILQHYMGCDDQIYRGLLKYHVDMAGAQ